MAPRETENNPYGKFWGDKQRALWYVMVFLEESILKSKTDLSYIFYHFIQVKYLERNRFYLYTRSSQFFNWRYRYLFITQSLTSTIKKIYTITTKLFKRCFNKKEVLPFHPLVTGMYQLTY